ncbi:DUF1579 domain-containing protein [Pseudoalteromonas sp. S16_S37]|uniref:DUF1579 domain-containing protein n=1 Tax=Pseudoalteromonas sp. S16_S37 TaxID=2720228 RepID=UPI0016816E1E|nr:DUF1579 domain-containing protein [Pseudoalteromonas sp. S16_S37]MBD1584298.1 DUF1579 domain-containing protein [Pseudoalteromonas sp. S16_S37]
MTAHSINQPQTSHSWHDFDFAIGSWAVKHRRLKDLFAREEQWIEFTGTSKTQHILGGQGNVEDNVLHFPSGTFKAAAFRSYNPTTNKWAIWWLDGRFPDRLDVPVIGEFKNGIGLFYADDVFNNIATKVRFIWDTSDPKTPRWEQAFSIDNGHTWKTNWTMIFTRAN